MVAVGHIREHHIHRPANGFTQFAATAASSSISPCTSTCTPPIGSISRMSIATIFRSSSSSGSSWSTINLRPAPRRGAQIHHPLAGLEQFEPLVNLQQLVGRA